jgi:hypothetical protein
MTSKPKWHVLVWMSILACGVAFLQSPPQSWAAGADASLPEGLSAPAQPAPMPEFSVSDLSGATLRSADLRGKVVAIRFWATW